MASQGGKTKIPGFQTEWTSLSQMAGEFETHWASAVARVQHELLIADN